MSTMGMPLTSWAVSRSCPVSCPAWCPASSGVSSVSSAVSSGTSGAGPRSAWVSVAGVDAPPPGWCHRRSRRGRCRPLGSRARTAPARGLAGALGLDRLLGLVGHGLTLEVAALVERGVHLGREQVPAFGREVDAVAGTDAYRLAVLTGKRGRVRRRPRPRTACMRRRSALAGASPRRRAPPRSRPARPRPCARSCIVGAPTQYTSRCPALLPPLSNASSISVTSCAYSAFHSG